MVLINQYINFKIGGVTVAATSTELNYNAGVIPGTASADKTLVLDSSKNISGINQLSATSLSGTLITASQPNITSLGTLSTLSISNATIIGENSGGANQGFLRITRNTGNIYLQSGYTNTSASSTNIYFTNYNETTSSSRILTYQSDGFLGVQTIVPSKQLTVNNATGSCLRLTHDAKNGSPTNYSDFDVNSSGELTITTTGNFTNITKQLKVNGAISNFNTGAVQIRALDNTNLSGRTILKDLITTINLTDYDPVGVIDNYTLEIWGYIRPLYTQTYTFYITHDDNCRFFIDGSNLYQNWTTGTINGAASTPYGLTAGVWFPIYIQSVETTGTQKIIVEWESTSQTREIIPSSRLAWDDKLPNVFKRTNIYEGLNIHNNTTTSATFMNFNVNSSGDLTITPSATGTRLLTFTSPDKTYLSINSTGGTDTVHQVLRFNSHNAIRGGGIEWINSTNTNRYFFGRAYQAASVISKLTYNVGLSGGDIYNQTNSVFTIQDDGKIGIRTLNPDRQLEINSATGQCLRLTYNDSDGSASFYSDFSIDSTGNLTITPSGGNSYIKSSTFVDINNSAAFAVRKADTTTILRVDTISSRVGINTTSPDKVLDINSTTGDCLRLTYNDSALNYTDLSVSSGGNFVITPSSNITSNVGILSVDYTNASGFRVRNTGGTIESFRVSTDQTLGLNKVGINTTGPNGALEINHSTGNCLRLTYNNSSGSATLYTDLTINSSGHLLIASSGSNVILNQTKERIIITATDAFTVDNNTNIAFKVDTTNIRAGVGTSIPSKTFDINNSTGSCLRLSYNAPTGSPTNYVDLDVSSTGNLNIFASGGITNIEGGLIIDDTSTEALLVRKNGDTGDIFTIDTTNSIVRIGTSTSLNINSETMYPMIVKDVNFTTGTYSNSNFYPVALRRSMAGTNGAIPMITFQIIGASLSNSDLYNENTIYGIARGGGVTDHIDYYDVTIQKFSDTEHRMLGIFRGTTSFSDGIVIYLRGGYTYSITTDANAFNIGIDTTALTIGVSIFAIKNSSRTDVTGTSTNIIEMIALDTTSGKYVKGNISATSYTGLIATNVQPNITSLGTLTALNTSGSNVGINTSSADRALEINNTTGECLRLTYNDSNGSASNYVDLSVTATGDMTISASGGDVNIATHNGSTLGLQLGGTLVTATATEINYLDLSTGPGTAQASKALVLDDSSNITGINILTADTINTSNFSFSGDLIVDNTSTEALLIRKDGDTGDIFTVDTTNSITRFTGSLNINSETMYPMIVKDVNLTTGTYSNSNFYPVALRHNMAGAYGDMPIITFQICGVSLSSSDSYNENTVYGVARGGGFSDHKDYYDVAIQKHTESEHRMLGIFRGTTSFIDGIVIYLRGGYTYSIITDADMFNIGTDTAALTIGASIFAIKNSSRTDVTGISTNIIELIALDTSSGKYVKGNISSTNYTGTISTTAQPNITSLGTLTALNTSGSNVGINTSSADRSLEVNNTTGNCLRLTYNDSNGSAVNYVDLLVSSSGDMTITATGGDVNISTHNGSTLGLQLGGTLVTASATEINYLDLTTGPGTAQANKALVLNSSSNITGINSLSATSLTGTLQTAAQTNITSLGTLTTLACTGTSTFGIVDTSILRVISSGSTFYLQPGVSNSSGSACDFFIGNAFQTTITSARKFMIKADGKSGIGTYAPDKQLEINNATGDCLRLTYNDSDGTATNYVDFLVTSSGDLTISASGGDVNISTHNGSTLGLQLGGTLVTATAAELNILDGVTATAAELNILDGVTATAAELNILDGVTATATEINYLDLTTGPGTAQASKALVLNSSSNITGINSLTATSLTGTIATNAQPNITSLGTLTGLTCTGTSTFGVVDSSIIRVTSSGSIFYIQAGVSNTTGSACDFFIGNILQSTTLSTRKFMIKADGKIGIGTTAPDKQLEINNATGDCLRLTYNDSDGTATNYADFNVSSGGDLTIRASGSDLSITQTRCQVLIGSSFAFQVTDGTNIAFRVDTINSIVEINQHDGTTKGLKLGATLVTATAAELNILDGVTATGTEINYLDLTTGPGTAQSSKALVLDSSSNITGINSLSATSLTGTLQTAAQPNITSLGTLIGLTTSGNLIIDNTSTEALLIRKVGDTGDIFTVDTTNSITRFTGSLSINSETMYPMIVKDINLTTGTYTNSRFYPVALRHNIVGTNGSFPMITFQIIGASLPNADPYNENTVYGIARGGGFSDHKEYGEVFIRKYTETEHRMLGVFRGTTSFEDGIVIYLRGGYTYSITTDADAFDIGTDTTALTINSSTFGIKNSSRTDVVGTSADIAELIALDTSSGKFLRGRFGMKQIEETNTDTNGFTIEKSSTTDKWGMYINTSNDLQFSFNNVNRGFLANGVNVNNIDFTGQHRSKTDNIDIYNNIINYIGLIVSSTGEYVNINNGELNVNEALPKIQLSNQVNDKKVFGVISNKEDEERSYQVGAFGTIVDKVEGDDRIIINSVGEGMVWVCNSNGSFENGDLITTSSCIGYGQLQVDDLLHNYTLGKITQNCDFSTPDRYIDLLGNIVDKITFDSDPSNHRKCNFVGCVYYCG